jgi:hypothetical protein
MKHRRWCLWCKTEDTQPLNQPCVTCQKYGRTSVNPNRRQKVMSR